MGLDMTVNRLPAPTWNWLHMNEARLKEIAVNREGRLSLETPDRIDTYEEKKEKPEQNMEEYAETASNPESVRKQLSDIPSGMGADMDALLNQNGAGFRIWRTAPGDKETEPVRLHFNYKDGEKVQNRIGIYAGKDSELTVIMDFRGEGELQSPESVAAGNDGNNRNSEND
ncbi:MAG: hypothetical protein LIO94_00125 [Clostridiales bacterium]|nr:hypothetical protein [Clostridiales bacterium]